ncbi:MarR family transcriptional regulator [Candidatus Saccharibacteria bacterium]|nr:MarR family transcriptional regulator [Candidatus Saccharibacteria bacterium]
MKEDKCLRLSNQLCFPLYAAAREVTRKYKPFLDEIGLTYTQYIVMLVLWENGTIPMQELGKKLYLDSGTLTPVLVKLEEKALIGRKRNEKDVREMIIFVTDKGVGLKVQAREIPKKIGKCLNLSVRDAVQLKRILGKILD